MQIGTSYFVSKSAALRYYAYEGATESSIERKLAEGLIHIGKPPLKPGERLLVIDDGTRYAIDDSDRAKNPDYWTLEQFAQHYAETMQKPPNGWGQYVSPIFGQSHFIMIAATKRFGESEVEKAFSAVMKGK